VITERQIRFLIEQYYDIQKLRVEAFNRIVAYVKSHINIETHLKNASQIRTENHKIRASQNKYETHRRGASQEIDETQVQVASQDSFELHTADASVKPSIIAHKITKGKLSVPKEIADLVWYHNALLETEKQLAKRLNAWSSHHPLRINFLNRIRGIGAILSSGLIAWLHPISRFPNISKLWKYCGLAPGQKRKRGQKLNYNPHLKTLMWKIATSFEKQKASKSIYRRLYEEKKRYLNEREDLKKAVEEKRKGAKLHIRLLALRFIAKRFLADLWVTWRKLEGLPITKPYSVAILGHELQPIQLDREGDENEEVEK